MGFIIGLLIIGALIAVIYGREAAQNTLGCLFWGAIIVLDIICVVIAAIFFPTFLYVVLGMVAIFLVVIACTFVGFARTNNRYAQKQREQRASYQDQVARKNYHIKTCGIALGQALQQAHDAEAIGLCRQLFDVEKPMPGQISENVLTLLAAAMAEKDPKVKLCAFKTIGGACDYRVWYKSGMVPPDRLSWDQAGRAYQQAIVSSNHPLSAIAGGLAHVIETERYTELRVAAATTIGQSYCVLALDGLMAHIVDRDPVVRLACLRSVARLLNDQIMNSLASNPILHQGMHGLLSLIDEGDEQSKLAAVEILAKLRSPAVARVLEPLANKTSEPVSVRRAAQAAIIALGSAG